MKRRNPNDQCINCQNVEPLASCGQCWYCCPHEHRSELRETTCSRCNQQSDDVEMRYSLGLPAGRMCDVCWLSSGYRDEGPEGFDPSDAGESYESDADFRRNPQGPLRVGHCVDCGKEYRHTSRPLKIIPSECECGGKICTCLLTTPHGERQLTVKERREIGYCSAHQATRCHQCGSTEGAHRVGLSLTLCEKCRRGWNQGKGYVHPLDTDDPFNRKLRGEFFGIAGVPRQEPLDRPRKRGRPRKPNPTNAKGEYRSFPLDLPLIRKPCACGSCYCECPKCHQAGKCGCMECLMECPQHQRVFSHPRKPKATFGKSTKLKRKSKKKCRF